MARSIWSGSISFGLVYIPVQMFSAIHEQNISFHMMSEDGSCRLRRKLVCPETGKEYDYEHTTLGYEVAPDQYVIVDRDDLKKLKPESERAITIERFVKLEEIDPIYFDRTYYLGPDEGGAKPYRLLAEAMQSSGRVALARFVMREKEYLAALRVIDGIIGLETLHYHDEIGSRDEIQRVDDRVQLDRRELELARQLIDQLTAEFEPDSFRNEYLERVQELI
ncbi:MAG: Ku protein, partial [Candidatus Eisenbacteria bacterium]|nr:Ku protein [Candidatus Eisenbacteria bacterium]